MGGTVARCEQLIECGGFVQQMSVNVSKLVPMQADPALREAIERCAVINADGMAVVWASRLLGDPLPERVAGVDLMHELIGLAVRRGYPIYVLGARAEVLETAVARLRELSPGLRIAGYRDGYFDEAESPEVVAAIRDSGARILFVAMSSPRKESWLAAHGPELGVSLAMGVGGSIDIVAGVTKRAPLLWQRLGLEWLYRMLQEPRRMLRRYLGTNLRFCLLVARELIRRRGRSAARPASQ